MELKQFESLGRDLRDSILRLLRDYSEALLLAMLMAIILRTFVFATYKISNPTMEPGLMLGDFIVGYKLPYGAAVPFTAIKLGKSSPRRGDVLIFRCPHLEDQNCVKRVVAVAGDRVEIRGERLIVNGVTAQYARSAALPSKALLTQAQFAVLQESLKNHKRDILIADKEAKVDFGPYIVPPETFFALGDNRDFSEDSRHWGAVPIASIEARALLVWFSIEWTPKKNGRGYTGHARWPIIFDRVH